MPHGASRPQQAAAAAASQANIPTWVRVARALTPKLMGYLSALALGVSLIFGVVALNWANLTTTAAEKGITPVGQAKMLILVGWILLPPVWFWLEYFGVYTHGRAGDPDDLDSFKYGQDISSKIWLATITALTILYFGKDIKG